jgi:hypothetical protein
MTDPEHKVRVVTPRAPADSSAVFGDILCGRGSGSHHQEPNVKLRHLLRSLLDLYDASMSVNAGKRTVVTMILDFLSEQGGRFIHYDLASDSWETFSWHRSYQKVSQTFRDIRGIERNDPTKKTKTSHTLSGKDTAACRSLRDKIKRFIQSPTSHQDSAANRVLKAATRLPSQSQPARRKPPVPSLPKRKQPTLMKACPRRARATAARLIGSQVARAIRSNRARSRRVLLGGAGTVSAPKHKIKGVVAPIASDAPTPARDATLAPRRADPRRVSLELGSDEIGKSSHTSTTPQRNLFGAVGARAKEEPINITQVVFEADEMSCINRYDTPKSSNRRTGEDVSPSLVRILGFSPVTAGSTPTVAWKRVTPSEASNDPLVFLIDPLAIVDTDTKPRAERAIIDDDSLPGPNPVLQVDAPLHPYPLGDGRMEYTFEDAHKERLRDIFDVQTISDDEDDSYNQRLKDMLFLSSDSTGELMDTLSTQSSLTIEDEMDISVAWSHGTLPQEEEMTVGPKVPNHAGQIVPV